MYEANQMIRYRFIDSFNIFKIKPSEYGSYNCSGPKINTENAEWFLFQIGRDVQLSKNLIDIGLRFNYGKKTYNYDERDMHSIIMKVYIHFISIWEKDVKVEREMIIKKLYERKKLLDDTVKPKIKYKIEIEMASLNNQLESINSEIERFVKTIIGTRIKIEDRVVCLFSNNLNLIEKIKQIVLESKFVFNKVDKEETKSWWEQTLKEN